ncbi:Os01g0183950, partial [Oryza sativa Japonica Group]
PCIAEEQQAEATDGDDHRHGHDERVQRRRHHRRDARREEDGQRRRERPDGQPQPLPRHGGGRRGAVGGERLEPADAVEEQREHGVRGGDEGEVTRFRRRAVGARGDVAGDEEARDDAREQRVVAVLL